jgi:hypothetical protein
VNSQISCGVSGNKEMDLVERLTPYETKKEIIYEVRALATPGVIAPTVGGRGRETDKNLDDCDNLD